MDSGESLERVCSKVGEAEWSAAARADSISSAFCSSYSFEVMSTESSRVPR